MLSVSSTLMRTISLVLLWLLAFPVVSQEHIRLVSYNVENLFDCKDDSLTNDETFLPTSLRHWTEYRYWNKLHAISRALTAIGGDRAPELVRWRMIVCSTILRAVHRCAPSVTIIW